MEDSTNNGEILAQQIDIKSKQLDTLQMRLAILQNAPKTDMAELQRTLDAKQAAYNKAESAFASAYTNNVMAIARTCVDNLGVFQLKRFQKAASVAKIAESAFKGIEKGMASITTAQAAVTQASRAYTLMMTAQAVAGATDTSQEITRIKFEIASVTKDINQLTARLASIPSETTTPAPATLVDGYTAGVDQPGETASSDLEPNLPSVADISLFPQAAGSSTGGSRWQEVSMTHEMSTTWSASTSTAEGAMEKMDCNLFLGSAHHEISSTKVMQTAASGGKSLTVEIGFWCTLVTVDRGGWFQPQFFKQSQAFHHIDKEVTWSKWPDTVRSMADLRKAEPAVLEGINKHLLPAFSTGFLVCKDITIKVTFGADAMKNDRGDMKSMAQKSGGFLCFSGDSTKHSQSTSQSCSTTQASDGIVIRIPGPQILGYMMQYTDPEVTTLLPKTLPADFLLSDTDYDPDFQSPMPAFPDKPLPYPR